ncbi:response regulator [Candidatus Ruminimicrobiellum ovillum]|uniref:response regulator n=1 Tax=Candidatus Ruminimicrobiellum ovillum TaxID=1947927 RepID=UPI003559CB3C
MEKKIIALTDDDSNIRNALERTILKHFDNVEVKQFSSTLEIKKFLLNNPNAINLLILDIHFGVGETGIDILPFIKQTAPSVQVILLSAMEKTYGESVTEVAGDMIFDFMSKPVTETELIVKVRKALRTQESSLNKTVQDLQSQNTLLSSMLDNKQQSQTGAGRMFEEEIFNKISQFNKVVLSPKKNAVVLGQEIDVIAFTKPPLPFTVLIFETKYFPNAKLIGSANEDTKIIIDGKEILSEKRRNLFEQTDNQFKQVSKKIEKILKENNFNIRDEFYRPFIQTFAVFTDSTDISGLDLKNGNRYTKFLKAKELTADLIIKTVFASPKRNVTEQVKNLILENLTK